MHIAYEVMMITLFFLGVTLSPPANKASKSAQHVKTDPPQLFVAISTM
jgi:hypothetical protein